MNRHINMTLAGDGESVRVQRRRPTGFGTGKVEGNNLALCGAVMVNKFDHLDGATFGAHGAHDEICRD